MATRPCKFSKFVLALLLSFSACATASVTVSPDQYARMEKPGSIWNGAAEFQGILAKLSRQEVSDASIVLVSVRVPNEKGPIEGDTPIRASFGDITVPFYNLNSQMAGEPGVYQGVLGVPYDHPSGLHWVEVQIQMPDRKVSVRLPLSVVPGKYRSETLTVDPAKANKLPEEIIPRITKEKEAIEKVYSTVTAKRMWDSNFRLPVNSKVTSPFGTRRVYNGELQRFHSGLDLRAAVGVPIRAPAGGRIALARDLYFTGNTVLIDHGFGVITLYGHLSELQVKEGQIVKTRQKIGKAGATGRVTGPHLHWSAIIHGAKVNPTELVEQMQHFAVDSTLSSQSAF